MKRVAVIGGGIGGLTAAGELAREGHDVTLFEATAEVGGKAQVVSSGGVVLDTGPTLLAMPEVVKAEFERLGALDLLPRFHRLPMQSRYVFSDGCSFDCFEDVERTAESVSDIRPSDGRAVKAFYGEAETIWRAAGEPYLEGPFEGMATFMARALKRGLGTVFTGLKLSTLDQLAAQHFRTDHLRQFVGRFATYAGASPYQASAAFAQIAHIERAFGVHHVEGGMGALVQALVSAVRRLGVSIVTGAKATYRRAGAEVLVGPAGSELAFDAVVVNADPLTELGRADEPLSMSGFVFHAEVDRRLVSLPHHFVSFSPDYRREFEELFSGRVPESPTIYVNHAAATDATVAPANKSGLYVMVNVPAFSPAADAEAVARAWEQVGPQLEAHCWERLQFQVPELVGVPRRTFARRTPVDLAKKGAPGGSIYGFLPHGRLGPFRRPKQRSATRGVFYAGGGTYPGGGVFMVMLSGRHAASLTHAHLHGAV
jgi:1-hydroxycarotenoid 3,4-desaturase